MANNKEVLKQTTQEVETMFSNPERARRDMASMGETAKIMSDLVLDGKATVEIKVDESGNKYANVKQGEELIHSTRDAEEVKNFEEYLNDPEQHLRDRQRKQIESDLNEDVAHAIEEQNRDNNSQEEEEE